jgi:hypothetical protein
MDNIFIITLFFHELCQMLVEIQNKIISTEVFEKKFVCDLASCKGACCVEGDAGAPLTREETAILKNEFELYKPYMRPEGIQAIEQQGTSYSFMNEELTTLVNNKECAYAYFEENGTAKCAIEKANSEGKTEFKKPVSCHLYPIRVKEFKEVTALNYDVWDICSPACACGSELNVAVYKFLKEPLIRAFGSEFYSEMEEVGREMEKLKPGD